MKLKNVTIQRMLIAGAVLITFILIFIIMFSNYSIKDTVNQYKLISLIKDIKNKQIDIINAENNLLIYETINSDFYVNGQSVYIDKINENLNFINSELDKLSVDKNIRKMGLEPQIKETKQAVVSYKLHIEELIKSVLRKGFKDFGYVGEMRNKIHAVESELKTLDNETYKVYMLTLRRHEKDFLLRKDLKYRDKFDATIKNFISYVKKGPRSHQTIIMGIEDYSKIFHTVIEQDIIITLNIKKEISKNMVQIASNLDVLTDVVSKTSEKKISKTARNISIFLVALSIIILLILTKISRHIVKSIVNIKDYVTLLGKGELPDEIPVHNDDEIAHMKKSINELTKNLRNTKEFAEAVGVGNYEKEVNVFGNEGDLGLALVDMRKKIIEVSVEREKDIKKSNQRLWANEGFNIIHNILSSNTSIDSSLFLSIISSLTRYLEANQGTILTLEEGINGEQVLVTKGTFAFDRNKINDREIKIGEGLIGAVAFEKKSLYMTDVPENYINITSGLGDAPPGHLLIVPCIIEDEMVGVIEIASFKPIEEYKIDFVERVALDIANSIKKISIEETTKELLERTQIQAQELTEKEEEMRQNLEELNATQEDMQRREKKLVEEIELLREENENIKKQFLEPSMQ